jgi:hypothetical protein
VSRETFSPAALAERAEFVRNQLPEGGLFAGQTWRIAPEPFALGADLHEELQSLGRVLLQFNRAVNLLYRQSLAGKQPPWVAEWLDQGKTQKILAVQRTAPLKNELPRVLRPDLLVTEDGLALTELDSVPGGIGLTAWLNRTYAETGADVVGGRDGMLHGFGSIFGGAPVVHVVVSDEAATYRPEMAWACRQLNALGYCFAHRDTQPFEFSPGEAVYRFFELFDLDHVAAADSLLEAAVRKQILLTPPPKAFFEEKLLLALLWNDHLFDFWRREVGASFFLQLRDLVPYTWVMDPAPLPPQAAIPELNLVDWQELKKLSQRDRELILKVSGFSPEAWGSRGVHLGSDLSAADWSAVVDKALASFPTSPYVLQRFLKPRTTPSVWYDFENRQLSSFPGRVRLCPYYFVTGEGDEARANLGGVLATTCPADKKIIHGMSDAILAPCCV